MDDKIVRDLALKYALFVDDKAYDRMGEILAEDVEMGSPAFETKGIPAFKEQLLFLENFPRTMHIIGNQIGEWNGDTWQGETYCIASHIYEKDGVERKLEMAIRYKDTIAPTDDGHKYTRRYLDVVWSQYLPLVMPGGMEL